MRLDSTAICLDCSAQHPIWARRASHASDQSCHNSGQRREDGLLHPYSRGTVKNVAHPQAEAGEAPAGRRDNLKASIGLNEAHKQLAQVNVMPAQMQATIITPRNPGNPIMMDVHWAGVQRGNSEDQLLQQIASTSRLCKPHLRNFLMFSVP